MIHGSTRSKTVCSKSELSIRDFGIVDDENEPTRYRVDFVGAAACPRFWSSWRSGWAKILKSLCYLELQGADATFGDRECKILVKYQLPKCTKIPKYIKNFHFFEIFWILVRRFFTFSGGFRRFPLIFLKEREKCLRMPPFPLKSASIQPIF